MGCLVLNAFDVMSANRFQFRQITPGIETMPCSFSLPRHRHLGAYVTVVLAGRLEESGYAGRIHATAGDVLVHPTLDCHVNQMVSAGVKLIRLEWTDSAETGGIYRVDEVDELARLAEKDVRAATLFLESILRRNRLRSAAQKNDWPDLLLTKLLGNASASIGTWAEQNGLARETVSRGFNSAYGVTPSVLRAELRARTAWFRITAGRDRLCSIAAETGFADQAHMTRWVQRITGAPPAVWRRNFLENPQRFAKPI
jgi:AraC-like DNA-binding protein